MSEERKSESKSVQRTVNLSLGLSEVEDEEAMIAIRNENRKKSTVNLSLGLGRMNSFEEGEFKIPGNPMLKVGLEVTSGDDTSESKGGEELMSMAAMMSALGNDSLEGESWEKKADTREERETTESNNILEQLGLTSSEETECWEKKASTEVESSTDKSLPSENMFNMLGLSASDLQSSGEAWESKTPMI